MVHTSAGGGPLKTPSSGLACREIAVTVKSLRSYIFCQFSTKSLAAVLIAISYVNQISSIFHPG